MLSKPGCTWLFLLALSGFGDTSACETSSEGKYREVFVPKADIAFRQADRYLVAKDFKRLDSLIAEYRNSETFSPSGTPRIDLAYQALAMEADCGPTARPDDKEFAAQLGLLKQWRIASPRSTAPRIALAGYYRSAAWRARGTGYSDTVSETQAKQFHSLMQQASDILTPMRKEAERDAGWYGYMIDIGISQHWSPDQFNAMFERGFRRYLRHLNLAVSASRYYGPQWYGSHEELKEFTDSAVSMTRHLTGEILYARIYGTLRNAQAVKTQMIDWNRLKQGHEEQVQAYPQARFIISFADDACTMEDEPTMQKLFAEYDDQLKSELWKEKRYKYCKARQFGPASCYSWQDPYEYRCVTNDK
jgi:hypothetical protein